MKRNTIITFLALATVLAIVTTACKDKREPGRVYMPDMAYSRAVETYSELDSSFSTDSSEFGHKIFYNRKPVDSTMRRGEELPFMAPPPTPDSAGYRKSESIKNPLGPLTTADSLEASRLFNINCAICHGADAGNDGPVSSKIGGVKNILQAAKTYSDGHIFYIMTYGQGNMGSYASQLSRQQRWQIIQYIRSLEPKTDTKAATDTTAKH